VKTGGGDDGEFLAVEGQLSGFDQGVTPAADAFQVLGDLIG
jgi:hypothetical protein